MNRSNTYAQMQINETAEATALPAAQKLDSQTPESDLPDHSPIVQCKLQVGAPDDPMEKEADAMADHVMRMPDGSFIQRKCADCEKEEDENEMVQRKETNNSSTPTIDGSLANSIESSRGNGQQMDHVTKSFMESRFGSGFGHVGIHSGGQAAQLSRQLKARAFTVGSDIYFNEGEYQPGTDKGKYLLAHELTHTLQQSKQHTTAQAKLVQRAMTPEAINEVAGQIREATEGIGTDEELIFRNLQRLNKDPADIQTLIAAYRSRYNESLESLLRDEMSGSELRLALEEVNIVDPRNGAMIAAAAPTTPAEYSLAAERLRSAMSGPGTDEETIYAVLIPFNRDPAKLLELKKTYLSLQGSALIADIIDEMSSTELAYALYLLNTTEQTDDTSNAMGALVGTRAGWVPSGPGSGNDFEVWASAPTESAVPPLSSSTTINCWEMILYAAYQAAAIDWNWIHNLYVNVDSSRWVSEMTSSRRAYSPGMQLRRGQLVFFDGLAHVTLATGNGDEVYTFWPPPNTPFTPHAARHATVDEVKLRTINALSTWMTAHLGAPTIEVGDPAWWSSR
jgi:hypothetical protein